MEEFRNRYYPTILQSIHLIILYIFIQTLVDFPLALIDYYKGTDYLYHPAKKIILGVGSTVFILYYGFRKTGSRLKEVFPLKPFNLLAILPLALFFVGAHVLIGEVNTGVEKVIPPPAWFWELFNNIFESDFGLWGAFFKVVLVAPIVEELIFRGVIMHGLMRNYSKITAILMSGLLFALFHLNPWQFPATFVLGILLGWLMIRTRNIGLCILGHALNNGWVLLSITLSQKFESAETMQLPKSEFLILAGGLTLLSVAAMILLTRRKKIAKTPVSA